MSAGQKAFLKGVAVSVVGAFVYEFIARKLKEAKQTPAG